MNVKLEARWQKVKSTVPMIIDACHNRRGSTSFASEFTIISKESGCLDGSLGGWIELK